MEQTQLALLLVGMNGHLLIGEWAPSPHIHLPAPPVGAQMIRVPLHQTAVAESCLGK